MNVFTEDAGRFLRPRETQSMKDAYKTRKLSIGIREEECIRSEFFGMNQVMHLLSQPGCVGLRVHHAKRWEDADGNPTEDGLGHLIPRVLLTGVDAQGQDMPVQNWAVQADTSGLKDMPQGDDGGGVQVLGDGFTCPRHCPQQ